MNQQFRNSYDMRMKNQLGVYDGAASDNYSSNEEIGEEGYVGFASLRGRNSHLVVLLVPLLLIQEGTPREDGKRTIMVHDSLICFRVSSHCRDHSYLFLPPLSVMRSSELLPLDLDASTFGPWQTSAYRDHFPSVLHSRFLVSSHGPNSRKT